MKRRKRRAPVLNLRRARFTIIRSALPFLITVLASLPSSGAETPAKTPDYVAVDAIFTAHCLDCHGSKDPDGELVLENYQTLLKGGEAGAVILPHKSADSLLVKMVEGKFEKAGKKKIMPPGKREKLTADQIAVIKAWIDAGAPAPTTEIVKELVTPQIKPTVTPRDPVNALAFSETSKLVAVARYGEVELRSLADLRVTHRLSGHSGNVNALLFSHDGSELFAAGGQPGWGGEIKRWSVADGKLVASIKGHKDAIYSLALSPDGKLLATGSYDQKIKLWDIATGKELKPLNGHNGCVYDLAFRPDGKILASAAADRTVKLWDAVTGERRDTLSQSLKEVYAVAFSPDGKRLLAGGADNRLRVWEVSTNAAENSNPLVTSLFAHEGAILRIFMAEDGKTMLTCADDRTVKLWDPSVPRERAMLEKQADWVTAAVFLPDNRIMLGRSDGTLSLCDSDSGKAIPTAELAASAKLKSP